MTMELDEAQGGLQRFPFPKIESRTSAESLPLSTSQKLWIESGAVPQQDQWLSVVWRLEGRLDAATFARSFGRLTRRHSILRTRIVRRGGSLVQEISSDPEIRLALVSLEAVPADRQGYELYGQLKTLLESRPSLEVGLMHLRLFRLRPDLHVLGGFIHNAAMDATSHGMFFRELMEGYFRDVEGRPIAPEQPLQYSDFALWEAEWLTPDQIAWAEAFWTARLAEAQPLRLPKGRLYGDPATSWASERLLMPAELHAEAVQLATEHRVSLSALFYAALSIVLARWGRQDTALFGSVLNARPAGFRSVMGSFTQIRPFFVSLRGDPKLKDVVTDAGRALIAAHEVRTPVPPSILTGLSVGNVIVNYARSSFPGASASASEERAATEAARRENPAAQRLESVRGQPLLTVSRQDGSHAAMRPDSRRIRERPPVRHNGGQSSPSTLRAGPMNLPKQLAPEFTRDLYFNMMQTREGMHGLVVYSDVRHEAARIRKLIDDIFATMAAMKATPNSRISKIK